MVSIFALCIFLWIPGAHAEFDAFSGLDHVDLVRGVQQVLSNVKEMTRSQKPCRPASEPAIRCSRYTLSLLHDLPSSTPFLIRTPAMLAQPALMAPVHESFSHILRDTSAEATPFTGQEPEPIPCTLFARVKSLEDVLAEILKLGKKCPGCLHELNLLSHGEPGALQMFESNDSENNILGHDDVRQALSDAFAPGATIRIHGCQVGQGEMGQLFMTGIGELMLSRHGGTVLAHNKTSFTNIFANEAKDITFSSGEISVYQQPAGGKRGKFWRKINGYIFSTVGD